MRMLFVTSHPPDAPTDGIKIVSYNLIRELKVVYNYHIDLISFTPEESSPDLSRIEPYCNLIKIFTIKKQSITDQIVNLFKITPNQILKYYDSRAHGEFAEFIKGKKYHFIYIMPVEVWKYVAGIKELPRVLNTLDSHALREIRQFRQEPIHSIKKYYSLIRYFKMAFFEKNKYPVADSCILVSARDRDYLQKKRNRASFQVIPNGVDGNYFNPEAVHAFANGRIIVFTGDFGYRPNEMAALDLYKIYLRLKQKLPDIKLYLVGKKPTTRMRKTIVDKDAVITGFVEDIRPYLKSARVFVSVLKFGAGMKNKLLEVMAMQVPVVCSRFSVYGLESLKANGLVEIAKNSNEYLEKIKRLLNENEAQRDLGKRGRRFVLENNTWEQAAKAVNDLVRKIVEEH